MSMDPEAIVVACFVAAGIISLLYIILNAPPPPR